MWEESLLVSIHTLSEASVGCDAASHAHMGAASVTSSPRR
jgi:hypothetical protein